MHCMQQMLCQLVDAYPNLSDSPKWACLLLVHQIRNCEHCHFMVECKTKGMIYCTLIILTSSVAMLQGFAGWLRESLLTLLQ